MPPRINDRLSLRAAPATAAVDIRGAAAGASSSTPAPTSAVGAGTGALTTVQTLVRPGRVLPPPGFDDIGVNLLERIGDAFATGSKDASRLCSINRTFRTALSDRAFADKLCAQAHWPQAHDGICDAFERLLAQASHLPQRLRAEVMATVMAQLPERMRLPLPGLTSLLSALLQAIESLQDPLLQRESFLQLGKNFQTDYFRLQCFDAAAALGVKPSMNDFYRAFSKAGLAVLPGCVAAIAETTRGRRQRQASQAPRFWRALHQGR